jgi:hypothetical protein
MDVEGILTILDSFKRLRDQGQRLVVAAGTGQPGNLLRATRIDGVVPVFPREDAAMQALRGGGPPPPGPATWAAARAEAVARWRVVQHAIEQAPPQEILHHLTSMTALCERSETVSREFSAPLGVRCQFCPLFYVLGGRSEDVGCRSILEPIIQAIQVSNHESARAQVENLIRTIEAMPLPEESSPPDT